MASDTKKKSYFPHTYVIIFALIIVAAALTWVIPAGNFERVKDAASGKSIIVPDSFQFTQKNPVDLLSIPERIAKGMNATSSIIFLVLIVGGAFNIIIKTGMFQALAAKMAKAFAHREALIIPMFTTTFALACMVMGVNTFIGFGPVAIIIARSMGYDAIVGVSMVALGGAIGFSTGTFNPFTTGVAQAIGGLPMFSGLGFRFFSLLVFLVVTNVYIIRYAKKVKNDPTLSVVRDLEIAEVNSVGDSSQIDEMNGRHLVVLGVVVGLFSLLIYGGIQWKWGLNQSAALFIWMAILGGLCYGFSPNKIAVEFIDGAKKLTFGALIIGFARAISIILTDGHILDTVVFYLGGALGALPSLIQGTGMFLTQLIVNGLITSGSGQAAATMPIMFPVADMIGMTRQTAILAFNFGDGLSNYILPTSSALMGFLAVANIRYDQWMRYMWKLFLIWIVTGSVLVTVANLTGYGPF